jgi:hypothetical protein
MRRGMRRFWLVTVIDGHLPFQRKLEPTFLPLIFVSWDHKSFRCFAAGNFLSGDKKSPKNTFVVRVGCCPQTARP